MQSIQTHVKQLAISDSGLVFDPVSGTIATSNSTGVRILRAISEGKNPEEIATALAEEFQAPREMVDRDLHDFLLQLKGTVKLHD